MREVSGRAMNIDRIQSELIRLYGGRSQGVRGGGPAQGPAESRGADDSAGAARSDGFELSEGAAVLRRASAAVTGSPDVRESLVTQLRDQVQGGTYRPADNAVARRLLGYAD